jgi:DNA-binding SARP family transcriptional activator
MHPQRDRTNATPSLTTFRLHLLGGFELQAGTCSVHLGLAQQRLVALLALAREPLPRQTASRLLWPESSPERAAASLRSALCELRRAHLIAHGQCADRLALSPAVMLDVHALEDEAAQVNECRSTDVQELLDLAQRAVQYEDLLVDWADDGWLAAERERVVRLRIQLLEGLSRQLCAFGMHSIALYVALPAAHADPFREHAHELVMTCHLEAGNRVDALRHHGEYCRTLRRELDVPPSTRLHRLACTAVAPPPVSLLARE